MNVYHKSIDGLRGFAILLVIMFHCKVAYFGWAGVILFFVLSGYLITKVLWVEKEKPIPLRIKFKNFWARRVLRIFPLYYLYLFAIAILLLANLAPTLINSEMPWLFSYTYNFYLINVYERAEPSFLAGHLWTLSIEEQFYLFYPFLIFLFKRRHIKIAIIILIIVSVLFRFFYSFYQSANSNAFLDFHQASYVDSFLVGAVIYIFGFERMKPSKGFFVFLVCTLIIFISGLFMYLDVYKDQPFSINNYLSSFGIEPHYTKNYYRVWGLVQLNLFFSSVLLLILLPVNNWFQRWIKRILEIPPIVSIGRVSYGMYVFHAIIIWLLIDIFKKGPINKYLFFLLCVAVIWLVSIIIYHVYEKWFLVLKEKFR